MILLEVFVLLEFPNGQAMLTAIVEAIRSTSMSPCAIVKPMVWFATYER